jgi:hypothetical protein
MHLKHGKRAGNGAYTWKGTTSSVMVANRPKVRFWPDGSPGNYGWLFVYERDIQTYQKMATLHVKHRIRAPSLINKIRGSHGSNYKDCCPLRSNTAQSSIWWWYFRGTYCFHLQARFYYKKAHSYGTSANIYHTTHHTPEDSNFHVLKTWTHCKNKQIYTFYSKILKSAEERLNQTEL